MVFTVQHEVEAGGESGKTRNSTVMTKKKKTLQDLFRPPIDLLHKGTFETVSLKLVKVKYSL